MLRVAVPNKGSLSETATEILKEAGYVTRGDSKSLTITDDANGVEFYFLRPKDIAIYIASGHLDIGITGRDLAADTREEVDELLPLGFGASTFRYAAPAGEDWSIEKLQGRRIATSYPNLVRKDLNARGIDATVVRLDGAVEISIRLGVADAIADVVSTGRTLRKQGLEPFGEALCTSEAVIVGRKDAPVTDEMNVLIKRIEGILHARTYLMLDYNIPADKLEEASQITPGLSAPTVSPLANANWVAVRAMVPRKEANHLMDRLSAMGAKAILASDIRIARI
ncbi:ATP phosphoribosyltransferase [Corynebacterium sp. 320]|uniref:ATP phosphoribosyltransferase n=1 Tax=Corynebacterium zhongnanshanii TaxID=2768834 RepID=A0ABQ6VH26_9CORY|nr:MULTISPECIES: ATP phosphoribosyltransferase [Corynebacterium]KAB1503639.1 ATP phosphoribosyltransferase [Corynebacterium sp. 320]KAB1553260.1 ATP phosphoribosyltransferase [Corynebacterium sp. 321]KAB1553521.1 ATP phosphoribosyltransferase [Corynebacterium sp. 319]KAB3523509.1 ATP phosphoribosyltransferase [Corynebacterium zhongnanshanii]KAB3527775.1 ATP phosphoribosyltransferase [Corynebacterium sp. 250]